MNAPRPALTLVLLLLCAAVVLGVGLAGARKERITRTAADRQLFLEMVQPLQQEASRLDVVYQVNVQALHASLRTLDENDFAGHFTAFAGLRAVWLISRDGSANELWKSSGMGSAAPKPVFVKTATGWTSSFEFPILASAIFGADTSGWILTDKQKNWAGYFEHFGPDSSVFYLTDSLLVQERMESNFLKLLQLKWPPVRAAGQIAQVISPSGKMLIGNKLETPADLILPFGGRSGLWEVRCWDRKETVAYWDTGVLAVAVGTSVLLSLLGVVAYAAQSKALREVTARVSFVNRVSHELGTPLTNLTLSLDLAREALQEAPSTATKEVEKRLAIAQEESRRLGRLTANVLTFARGEQERLTQHPSYFAPAHNVQCVLDQFQPSFQRRGIQVSASLDESLTVHLDADFMSQITANLLSNVEKYASQGGKVMVLLGKAKHGTQFQLQVRDFGPGIPEAHLERLFRPFERLHTSLTEGVSGTGLGLSIVKDLAERSGGRVEAINLSDGLQMTVLLPLVKQRPVVASPS